MRRSVEPCAPALRLRSVISSEKYSKYSFVRVGATLLPRGPSMGEGDGEKISEYSFVRRGATLLVLCTYVQKGREERKKNIER